MMAAYISDEREERAEGAGLLSCWRRTLDWVPDRQWNLHPFPCRGHLSGMCLRQDSHSPNGIVNLVVVHLQLRGEGETTAEKQIHQTTKEPFHDGRKCSDLLGRDLWRWTSRRRTAVPIVLLVVIFDHKLGRLFRLLATVLPLDDIPLPQHLPLKDARLAVQLKDHGKDALQDPQAVQDLLGRVALAGATIDK